MAKMLKIGENLNTNLVNQIALAKTQMIELHQREQLAEQEEFDLDSYLHSEDKPKSALSLPPQQEDVIKIAHKVYDNGDEYHGQMDDAWHR